MKLIGGRGIEGDFHCGKERQVSLLLAGARRWMEAQSEKGLCFGRFRENIRIEGLPAEALSDGSTILIGDTALKLLPGGKHCFPQCRFFAEDAPCPLLGAAAFAVVSQGGIVRLGDAVS